MIQFLVVPLCKSMALRDNKRKYSDVPSTVPTRMDFSISKAQLIPTGRSSSETHAMSPHFDSYPVVGAAGRFTNLYCFHRTSHPRNRYNRLRRVSRQTHSPFVVNIDMSRAQALSSILGFQCGPQKSGAISGLASRPRIKATWD